MKNKKLLLALPLLLLFSMLFLPIQQDRKSDYLINDVGAEMAYTFPCAFCDTQVAACVAGGTFTEQECINMMASCYDECED